MNVKLLFGVALFLIGLVTAGVGILGVGSSEGPAVSISADHNEGTLERAVGNVVIPALGGMTLAVGAILIGLSLGNWKHPRTHLEPGDEVVDPEGYHKMRHV